MSKNLVFIDSCVSDHQSIIDSLSEDTPWMLLDADSDGMLQMEKALTDYRQSGSEKLDAIHVISHGSVGAMYLGNTVLNQSNLGFYDLVLRNIGAALTNNGDLLLYGCDVAQGEVGAQFIRILAEETGADVAGSLNLVGGVDWTLEVKNGSVEENHLVLTRYIGSLAIGSDTLGLNQISVGGTNDTLTGGDGNDTLQGFGGDDSISGLDGNDLLQGDAGWDSLLGGYGNDTLLGGDDADALDGGFGVDSLVGGLGNDSLLGGYGKDTLLGGDDADTLDGGFGVDSLVGGLGNDSLLGAEDDDILIGGEGNDTVRGGSGNDTLDGDDGDDVMEGGDGNDVLSGAEGNNSLLGGASNDSLSAGAGADLMDGGVGDDTLVGGDGADSLYGGGGLDLLVGGNGDDYLSFQSTYKQNFGWQQTDPWGYLTDGWEWRDIYAYYRGTLEGGAGDDILVGGVESSHDWLESAAQSAGLLRVLNGGSGNDLIRIDRSAVVDAGEGDDTVEIVYATPWNWEDVPYPLNMVGGQGVDSLRIATGYYGFAMDGAGDRVIDLTQTSGFESIRVEGLYNPHGSGWYRIDLSDATIASGLSLLLDVGSSSAFRIDASQETDAQLTIIGSQGCTVIIGGALQDSISGQDGADTLCGGGSDDTLLGAGGSDWLDGGNGNDWLDGGDGSDTLQGGSGDDTLYGGSGDDVAVFAGNAADYAWSAELDVSGNAYWKVQSKTSFAVTQLHSINTLSFDDQQVQVSSLGVNLYGAEVADTLTGGDGNDTLQGFGGNDSIDGGDGTDLVVFQGVRADYAIRINAQGLITVTDLVSDRDGTDLLSNIEWLRFTDCSIATANLSATSLHSIAYHWKNHSLLSGVSVQVIDNAAVASSSDLFDLRIASFDTATATLSVEVWANPVSVEGSFDFSAHNLQATAVSFVSALPSADWTVLANTNDPGHVSVGAFLSNIAATGITGATKLGTLTLTLAAGTSSTELSFNGINIGDTTVANQAFNMTAKMTDSDGQYTVSNLPSGDFSVSANRTTTDSGNAITSADALAALRMAVGINPNTDPDGSGPQLAPKVSPYQFIAADANQSGTVTSADALAILRMAVKLSTAPAQEWFFVEEMRDFWNETTQTFSLTRTNAAWDHQLPITNNPNMNLVGVLKGDINGSWAEPAGSANLDVLQPDYFVNLANLIGVPVDQWGM